MKRLAVLGCFFLAMAGPVLAGEYVGYLSDLKCARAGKAASEGHAKCAQSCVKGGEAIAFINDVDKRVYKVVEGVELAKPHVGSKVAVSAELEGEGETAVARLRKLTP